MNLIGIVQMFSHVIKKQSNFPLTDSYLSENHSTILTRDIPEFLNHYLGPQGLRVLTSTETIIGMFADVEEFLRGK